MTGESQDDAKLIQAQRHGSIVLPKLSPASSQHFPGDAFRLDKISGLSQSDRQMAFRNERETDARFCLARPRLPWLRG